MSETITSTEQVELVNIITFSQSRLVRNFQIIMKQLKHTNQRIDLINKRIQCAASDSTSSIEALRAQGHEVQGKLIDLFTEIGNVSNNLTSFSTDISVKTGEQGMKIVDLQLVNKQLSTKVDAVDKGLTASIQQVANQQNRIQDIIKSASSKQNYNFEKMQKQVGMLVIKNESMSKKQKFMAERIQSLEKQMAGEQSNILQDHIVQKVLKEVRKSPLGKSRKQISKIHVTRKQVRLNVVEEDDNLAIPSIKQTETVKPSVKQTETFKPSIKQTQINPIIKQTESINPSTKQTQAVNPSIKITDTATQSNKQTQLVNSSLKKIQSVKPIPKKIEFALPSIRQISVKNLLLKPSMKDIEGNNIEDQQNDAQVFVQSGQYFQIQDVKDSIQFLKNKIQSMQLSTPQPIGALIDALKRQIQEIRNSNDEIKKQLMKIKSDSSAVNLTEKLQQLRPELNKVWGVIAGTEDKNIFLQRKLDQMKKTLSEVSNYVKENNTGRYDQKIRMLQSDLFTQIKQTSTKLELKANSSQFYKYCHESAQQFKQIRSQLSNKCEKVQVKKALLFIESKIKQIILVISQDQEYEKDALLTKKQIKCVSCDKELDKQSGLVNSDPRHWNMMPQKQMQPQNFGKCGISRFGSLASKIRKLQGSQLPILKSKNKEKQNKCQDA